MKDKLEIGMYVRTKKGIAKIIGQNDDVRYCYPNAYISDTYLGINDDTEYLYEEDILKASFNIIDLIEVGDYVNGKKVGYIDDCEGAMREYYYDYEDVSVDVGHWFEEIKSIVTSQQFENMQYKVD